MTLTYSSFCSGIESPSVAWHPLGWTAMHFSEIDPFACAVLAHHYPRVPNLGDMERITDETAQGYAPDVVVAGTPCQSFSVAGLRKGMADPRGNLALVLLRLVDEIRPRWLVWENVAGVLSSHGGRDFGNFLGALGQLGYGWAYRVLDAQYFGVAQRRNRVFVVGYLGDWRRAAAVLLERSGLRGHPAPCRETGAGTTHGVAASIRSSGAGTSRVGDTRGQDNIIAANNFGERDTATALSTKNERLDGDTETFIVHALRADGFDASEDGTGRGTPIIPIQEVGKRCGKERPQNGSGIGQAGDPMFTLQAGAQHAVACDAFISARLTRNSHTSNQLGIKTDGLSDALSTDGPGAVAYGIDSDALDRTGEGVNGTAAERAGLGKERIGDYTGSLSANPGNAQFNGVWETSYGVRRLTPRECERLMGFPDNYTLVPYRGKPAADGPRYRALGNSIVTTVLAWIGRRIEMVEAIA